MFHSFRAKSLSILSLFLLQTLLSAGASAQSQYRVYLPYDSNSGYHTSLRYELFGVPKEGVLMHILVEKERVYIDYRSVTDGSEVKSAETYQIYKRTGDSRGYEISAFNLDPKATVASLKEVTRSEIQITSRSTHLIIFTQSYYIPDPNRDFIGLTPNGALRVDGGSYLQETLADDKEPISFENMKQRLGISNINPSRVLCRSILL